MGRRALTAAPALCLLDELGCKLLGVMEVLAVPVQSAYKCAVILSWAPEGCCSGNHTVMKSRESTRDSALPSVMLAGLSHRGEQITQRARTKEGRRLNEFPHSP